MAKRMNAVTRFLNEHVALCGCPQIVVTRFWAHSYFVKLGFPQQGNSHTAVGFGSADSMAYNARAVNEPLADLSEPWIVNVLARMEMDRAHG